MERNLIIYISLIIICIIIFTIFFYTNFEKRIKIELNKNNGLYEEEKFFPWDFDKNSENKPNFVKKYENGNFTVPPNYRYQDICI